MWWGTCCSLSLTGRVHIAQGLRYSLCFWCHPLSSLFSPVFLFGLAFSLSVLLIIGCMPVSGCCCPCICFVLCALCLMVSLCLSVLCSWTLLRKERYEFFVSSAHSGPAPLRSEADPHPPYLEFSLQLCSANRQGVTFPSRRLSQSHLKICQCSDLTQD